MILFLLKYGSIFIIISGETSENQTHLNDFADRCLDHSAIVSYLAGWEGLEPSQAVLETAVLPLHYQHIFGVPGRTRTLTNSFGDCDAAITLLIHNNFIGDDGGI